MKISVLAIAATLFLFMSACNKSNLEPPPWNPNVTANLHAGTYVGLFYEKWSGVDTSGIHKRDTSYIYQFNVQDAGLDIINISHGSVSIQSISVDSDNHFFFVDYKHNIKGSFIGDSLILSSHKLSGTHIYPQWFQIQTISFKGKR